MRLGQLKFSSVLFKYKNRKETIFPFFSVMGYDVPLRLQNTSGTYFGYVELADDPRRRFSEN